MSETGQPSEAVIKRTITNVDNITDAFVIDGKIVATRFYTKPNSPLQQDMTPSRELVSPILIDEQNHVNLQRNRLKKVARMRYIVTTVGALLFGTSALVNAYHVIDDSPDKNTNDNTTALIFNVGILSVGAGMFVRSQGKYYQLRSELDEREAHLKSLEVWSWHLPESSTED